jgi:uncharacterized Zn-finger protein
MSASSHPDETFYVDSHRVGCNGGGGALGHPLVYLELGGEGKAVCGYCGRVFLHADHAPVGATLYGDPSPRHEDH